MEQGERDQVELIRWNPKVKLIVADIDDTVAIPYEEATLEMIEQLTRVLEDGVKIFFVTGGGLQRAQKRVIEKIPERLRSGIMIAHCSGAEVWGHDEKGHLNTEPYYSLLDKTLTATQQDQWREVVTQVIDEFGLKTCDPVPAKQFTEETGGDFRSVMYDDRGPQITLECPNSYALSRAQAAQFPQIELVDGVEEYDLREVIIERSKMLLAEKELPINPGTGGIFALDYMLGGVSKTTAVEYVMENNEILGKWGLSSEDLKNPEYLEAWGDRYARDGSDNGMLKGLPKGVRALNFRQEDPETFNPEYNIVIWKGKHQLADGCAEYLQSREAS